MSEKLLLKRCACQEPVYTRLKRRWWMRLLTPGRRLYHCHVCDCQVLLPKRDEPEHVRHGHVRAGSPSPP